MRKFNKTEKMLIEFTDLDKYTAFLCPIHKLQFQRNDIIDQNCAYTCDEELICIQEEVRSFKNEREKITI